MKTEMMPVDAAKRKREKPSSGAETQTKRRRRSLTKEMKRPFRKRIHPVGRFENISSTKENLFAKARDGLNLIGTRIGTSRVIKLDAETNRTEVSQSNRRKARSRETIGDRHAIGAEVDKGREWKPLFASLIWISESNEIGSQCAKVD